MARYQKTKGEGDQLDWGFDWVAKGWLDTGELIVSSSWSASTGITILTSSNTTTTTTIWLSGGTAGETYVLTNTVTTDNSPERIITKRLYMKVIA